jgi:signal transduction histidine kinase
MMEELLLFSRTQQRELKCAPLDLRLLIDTVVVQLGTQVRSANAEIVTGPLGIVRGDADLLGIAFKHLLDNALKFRRNDCTPRIEISTTRELARSVIHVSDNGIGLAPELHEKAFRMFWQLSVQRGQPGVGAGLALCRRIVRRHGGEVRFVDSEQGACVAVALPTAESTH